MPYSRTFMLARPGQVDAASSDSLPVLHTEEIYSNDNGYTAHLLTVPLSQQQQELLLALLVRCKLDGAAD